MRSKLTVVGKGTKTNPNTGVSYTTVSDLFELHYATVKRTLNQTYSILGTRLDNTISVRIRHNPRVTEKNQVRIKDTLYDIVTIDSTAGNSPIEYDFLTLRKVNGKSWRWPDPLV